MYYKLICFNTSSKIEKLYKKNEFKSMKEEALFWCNNFKMQFTYEVI